MDLRWRQLGELRLWLVNSSVQGSSRKVTIFEKNILRKLWHAAKFLMCYLLIKYKIYNMKSETDLGENMMSLLSISLIYIQLSTVFATLHRAGKMRIHCFKL